MSSLLALLRPWVVIPAVAVSLTCVVAATVGREAVSCLGKVPSGCKYVRHYRCSDCKAGFCWVFECK
jgi:hypothetical protein